MSESPAAALSLNSSNIYARNVNNSINQTNQTIQHQTQTIHQTQTFLSRRDPIEILHEHVAFGALYNSRERYDPPKCHPQTRTAVLERIQRWAAGNSEDSKPIMWLSGPAGAGKSAIAQTLVEKWKKENLITLAFFFWRMSSERNQSTRLVPTLASELTGFSSSIKFCIKEVIGTGEVFNTNLGFQLGKLVVEPLRGIAPSRGQHSAVIVIDGLDECCIDIPKDKNFPGQTYESQQQEILEAFSAACREMDYLRLLVVSRPERQIRLSFGTSGLQTLTTSVSLKDTEDASADIRLFLDCSFQEIRQRHGIDPSWPTKDQLSELVQKSSGQFIYPSIVIQHITAARASPKQSLIAVLELQPGSSVNPLADLDMLYTLVLRSVAELSLPVVTDILGFILPHKPKTRFTEIYQTSPQTEANSLAKFENLLFLSEGEIESHLDDLHSVLDIPPRATGRPVRLIHATFSEYIQDSSRSGKFFISKEQVSIRYTQLLFRHLYHWSLHSEAQIYYERQLIDRICTWINNCPPSRSLMVHIWGLLQIKLGHYPLASSPMDKDHPLVSSKQLAVQFNDQLKELDNDNSNRYTNGLLTFLQKCNIPEIEPFWLRRYLVGWRLEAALRRHPQPLG